jgi:hypothetical protein
MLRSGLAPIHIEPSNSSSQRSSLVRMSVENFSVDYQPFRWSRIGDLLVHGFSAKMAVLFDPAEASEPRFQSILGHGRVKGVVLF